MVAPGLRGGLRLAAEKPWGLHSGRAQWWSWDWALGGLLSLSFPSSLASPQQFSTLWHLYSVWECCTITGLNSLRVVIISGYETNLTSEFPGFGLHCLFKLSQARHPWRGYSGVPAVHSQITPVCTSLTQEPLWRAAAPLSDLIPLLLLRLVVVWGNNKVQPSIIRHDQRGLSVVIDKSSWNNRLLELCPGTAGFGCGFALIFGLNKKNCVIKVAVLFAACLQTQKSDLKGYLTVYVSALPKTICSALFLSPLGYAEYFVCLQITLIPRVCSLQNRHKQRHLSIFHPCMYLAWWVTCWAHGHGFFTLGCPPSHVFFLKAPCMTLSRCFASFLDLLHLPFSVEKQKSLILKKVAVSCER